MHERLVQLQKIRFTVAGKWLLQDRALTFILDQFGEKSNILYAFVVDGELMYIGKTVKTLSRRMAGYRSPHRSQLTNERNHNNICGCLGEGRSVEIHVLPDNGLLHYGGFHINLAAGLEDDLIKKLNPIWNGGQKETENETLVPTLSDDY